MELAYIRKSPKARAFRRRLAESLRRVTISDHHKFNGILYMSFTRGAANRITNASG